MGLVLEVPTRWMQLHRWWTPDAAPGTVNSSAHCWSTRASYPPCLLIVLLIVAYLMDFITCVCLVGLFSTVIMVKNSPKMCNSCWKLVRLFSTCLNLRKSEQVNINTAAKLRLVKSEKYDTLEIYSAGYA